jgi:hypothetical protein
MAKKFLDYEGLDYYDSLIKDYITSGLNDTLKDAIATFAGVLQVKGTITGTVNMKTAYPNAKVGDTYFAKGENTKVTFIDTSGTTVTENLEDSDAIVCIVSQAATSSSNAAIQWATLNTNWAVENKNPTISFGSTPSTAIVGNVGGMNLTVQLPNSSTIVSGIASELRKEFVSGQKDNSFDETEQGNARENLGLGGVATMDKADTIGSNPSGNLIPTDLAVKNFVESKIGQSTSGVSDVQRFDNTTGQWLGHSVVNGGIARLPKIKMDANGNLTEYYPDMLATSGSSVIGSSVLFSTITDSEIDSLF